MPRLHILKGFSDLESALWVLKDKPGLQRRDMVRAVREKGFTVTNKAYEIVLLLSEWGLAESAQQKLTPEGNEFYSLWEKNSNAAVDVLHGLQYGLWSQYTPEQHIASWAYQQVCNYLWDYQTLPEDQNLVAHIYDSLLDWNNSQFDIGNAAFDSKSVKGAYDWLLPLSPPVFQGISETSGGRRNFRGAIFTRRASCSPALFLMGLSWMAREAGNEFGDLVAIDAARRLSVCRFCLIEENQFDFMLNETLRRFSYISVQRTVGLYLVIEREPKIADF